MYRRAFAIVLLWAGLPRFTAAQTPSADSAAIRQVVQLWWTTEDPKAYGSLHSTEVVSLEPDGQVVRGRAAVIREFTEDLANFKGYRVEAVAVGPLRFLGPNHVVVDGGFDVVGPTPPKMALCVRRHATAHS